MTPPALDHAQLDRELAILKGRRRDLRDLAVALPNTAPRRAGIGMELQAVESAIRLVHYRRGLLEDRVIAVAAATAAAQARTVRRAVQAVQYRPAVATPALPLPQVPRATRDADIVGYEVVWRPHRDAALLSDQFAARCS